MFSSKSFIVSGLMFRSLIHFEFIFVYGVRKCSSFIILQVVTGSLGLVHWDDPEGWYGEGGGGVFRMGNTYILVVDAYWCMAKSIQYCKVKKKIWNGDEEKKQRRVREKRGDIEDRERMTLQFPIEKNKTRGQ